MKKSTCLYFICSVVYLIMIVACLSSSISDFYLVGKQIGSSTSSYRGQGIINLAIFIVCFPFLVISFVMMVKSLKNKEKETNHAVILLLIGTILLFCFTAVFHLWQTIELINVYNERIYNEVSIPEVVLIYKSNRLNVIISFIVYLIQVSLCLGSAIAMYVFWKKEKLDTNPAVKVIEDENSNTASFDNSF